MSNEATGTTALLFPGQGVDVRALRPQVEAALPGLLATATDAVGDDPFARSQEGTRFAQPAIYLASLGGLEGVDTAAVDWLAGHSLGEITALVAADALSPAEGLKVVVARGRLMDEAAQSSEPGGMLAVGAGRGQAAALATEFDLAVANENSPEQQVLSGPADRVDAAQANAKEAGLRCKQLAVAGAFHSEAMEPAVAPFRQVLEEVDFAPPRVPVVSSVTAEVAPRDPRDTLARAIVSPVLWADAVRRLYAGGARRFVDAGPGKVVGRLAKRTLAGLPVETGEAPELQRV
jgi:[acyl-carrier-protein] S-malonyltransferase